MRYTIGVYGISLHAFVGLYPEEKITGNHFEIDVEVALNVADQTECPYVDYTVMHQIVQNVFSQPAELLETVAKEIHQNVRHRFPETEWAKVTVRKLQPPIEGIVKHAQVVIEG